MRPPLPGEPRPARAPTDLIQQARLSGRVPVVTGVMGASAGHGALIVPMSDFSVMTADACVFTAGPPVVLASLGEDVTKEELGGPEVAVASGLVHNVVADDGVLLDDIRAYLAFFPSSAWSHPPRLEGDDTGPRLLGDELDMEVFPRKAQKLIDLFGGTPYPHIAFIALDSTASRDPSPTCRKMNGALFFGSEWFHFKFLFL